MSNKTQSELAADSIREAILAGIYRPGDNLREEEISGRLNISRSSAREALLAVSRCGLVDVTPRHGASVVSLSSKYINEIFTLRARLESFAVGLAISCGYMTSERIRIVREAYEVIKMLSLKGSRQALVDADMRFHWSICEPCRHEVLLRVLGDLQLQTKLCISYTKLYNSDAQSEAESHLSILYSIESLDAQRAERAVMDHILSANQRLLVNMDRSKLAPGSSLIREKKDARTGQR
jgi:DNA-binding GntR family transcriptional regulator